MGEENLDGFKDRSPQDTPLEEYDLEIGESQDLNNKLKLYFDGRIVRKDLTKKIKEGANVPVYVLEYLLGNYCSQEEDLIEQGVQNVKNILANNYVRPDEAQKILSKLKERGTYSVIDVVTVTLNYKKDIYEASFSNLGISKVPISSKYPAQYERLLGGNLWCMVKFEYYYDEADYQANPFKIANLTPIQMPNLDIDEILEARQHFTKDEWIDLILRSCGMEPTQFDERVKWLLLTRLIPLVENNYNLCELGPRGTGKSHIYKEISPNSILVSGGQTTVANLFYNMSTHAIGLVGLWDCVAFDEVAGIRFKDQDGIAIMKDYMASGSFSRGKEEKNANASMVFVGNINQSVESLLKTSSLFDPFPQEMSNDSAFFDRMHSYIPGWEIPKYRPEFFTDDFGLISDYLAEFFREMRKRPFTDAFENYFSLGNQLNQRDVIAVKKTVSGLVKIVYPDGNFDKEDIEEILVMALELRRRVKEQLKRIGGMEFFDINFTYIDKDTLNEIPVGVMENNIGTLIPEGQLKPGHLYTVGSPGNGKFGVYKIETQMMNGNGNFKCTGIGSKKEVKEAVDTGYHYLKSNSNSISANISTKTKDYLMEVQDLNNIGMTNSLSLATLVGLSSVALNRPVLSSAVILGDFSIGGTIKKIENLDSILQVCLDAGAKKIVIPMSSIGDISAVPQEIVSKFSTIVLYSDPQDAVFKALGAD